jgi:hypothetical protein
MTTPDDADDTLEQLSPDDDAFVHDLLSSLPPVPMPPDVLARLNAALAAEAGIRSGTVVPLDQARRQRRPSTRVLSAAAALVLVVAGGYAVLRGQGTSGSDTSGSTAVAGAQPGTYAVEQTGTQYRTDALEAQVHTLVAHQTSTPAAETATPSVPPTLSSLDASGRTPTASDSSGSAGTSVAVAAPLSSLVASSTSLQGCLTAVEDTAPATEHVVAVDAGTFDGQPALVVVVLSAETSTQFGVFIVSPACNAGNAHEIAYHSVKRS